MIRCHRIFLAALVCLCVVSCCSVCQEAGTGQPADITKYIKLTPKGNFHSLMAMNAGGVYNSGLFKKMQDTYPALKAVVEQIQAFISMYGLSLDDVQAFSVASGDEGFEGFTCFLGVEDVEESIKQIRTESPDLKEKERYGVKYWVGDFGTAVSYIDGAMFMSSEAIIEGAIDIKAGKETGFLEASNIVPLMALVDTKASLFLLQWDNFDKHLAAVTRSLSEVLGEDAAPLIGECEAYGVSIYWGEALGISLKFKFDSEEAATKLENIASSRLPDLAKRYAHRIAARAYKAISTDVLTQIEIIPGEEGLAVENLALNRRGSAIEVRFDAGWDALESIQQASDGEEVFGMDARAVDVAPDGTIYLTCGQGRIYHFSADGRYINNWRLKPKDDEESKGKEEVPDEEELAVDAESEEFFDLEGIAAAPDGTVYVSESSRNKIYHFTADGKLIGEFGEEGYEPGQFDVPKGLAVDSEGNLYVADYFNGRIQVFNIDGKFLRIIGAEGEYEERISSPSDVAFARDGALLVIDSANDRIMKFAADGAHIASWEEDDDSAEGFGEWLSIAVASDGTMLVTDDEKMRVAVFSPDGKYLRSWGNGKFDPGRGFSTEVGRFIFPQGIAVGKDGAVYVVDGRIQQFTPDGELIRYWNGKEGSLY